jgi:hypothetical protein
VYITDAKCKPQSISTRVPETKMVQGKGNEKETEIKNYTRN